MIFEQTVGVQRVILECDASLEPAATDVFRTLSNLDRSGSTPRAGLRIRFGWSLLTLAEDAAGLRVCEPLFSGDPSTELNPTLDATLRVLVSQVRWLRQLKEQGSDVFFHQQILVTQDALAAGQIFALRGEQTSEDDSGWSVAPVPAPGESIDTRHLSALPIYSLVGSHPGLLSILTLPAGYLVRLDDGQVAEITSPDGRIGWQLPL